MSDSTRQDSPEENSLCQLANSIRELADIQLLRRIFVPSIRLRIQAVLEHLFRSDCAVKNFFGGFEAWCEASERLLRVDGLAGAFVDSIVISNRLDKIGRDLDDIGVQCPELRIDMAKGCEMLDYWATRCQSTTPCEKSDTKPPGPSISCDLGSDNPSQPAVPASTPEASSSGAESPPRQCCRKRKAGCCREEAPESSSTNPFDTCPSSFRDRSRSQTSSTKLRDRKAIAAAVRRSDKLRIVVTEVCRDGGTRRNDYLKLPCDSQALKKKVFGKRLKHSSGKLEERLKSVCNCLNNVMQRLGDKEANEAILSCDIRKTYVSFKLARVKSRLRVFASRVFLGGQRERNSNCSVKINVEIRNDDEANESLNSGDNESDQSVKYLWCKSGRGLSDSRIDAEKICGSKRANGEEEETSCGGEKREAANCPCDEKSEPKEAPKAPSPARKKCDRDSVQKERPDDSTGVKNSAKAANCPCNERSEPKESPKKLGCNGTAPSTARRKNDRDSAQKEKRDDSTRAKNDAKAANRPCNAKCEPKEAPKKLDCHGTDKKRSDRKSAKDPPTCRKEKIPEEREADEEAPQCPESRSDDGVDLLELTNVYINEISLCHCGAGDKDQESANNVGAKTEDKTCLASTGTNTNRPRFREISTQVFFKEIHFCACAKKPEEIELDNVSLDLDDGDADPAGCSCNKETSTDEKFTVIELDYPVPSGDDGDDSCLAVKTKIGEIVGLNEKIRQKFNSLKGRPGKQLCSVAVQTICRDSRGSRNVEIQVRASLGSLGQSDDDVVVGPRDDCAASKPREEDGRVGYCTTSTCPAKIREDATSLRRSILSEVAACLAAPALRKLQEANDEPPSVCLEETSSHFRLSRYAEGDTIYLHHDCVRTVSDTVYLRSESITCQHHHQHHHHHHHPNQQQVQRVCSCCKKSNFLNFCSEHLTKEAFDRCRSLVRSILRKLLERLKALGARRRRCRCGDDRPSRCCCCCSGSQRHGTTTCGPARLAGGGEPLAESTSRACGDFENRPARRTSRRRRRRRRELAARERRKLGEWERASLERCRRIEAFTADWPKP